MTELNIGKNIAELRKQKGITQEALAEVVGVTGQAVSKWESGGSPDIELLLPIADYFNTSIDKLFGRKAREYSDIKTELADSISTIENIEDRLQKVFDYCWIMQAAMMSHVSVKYLKMPDYLKESDGTYSQVLLNNGFTSLGIPEALRYFLVMPEPRGGWGDKLHFKEEYRRLFSLLGDESALKALFFLYARKNKAFTPKLLEKECGISQEKAVALLTQLIGIKLVHTSEIELDDETHIVYNFNANVAFIPLLTFAEELIRRPTNFHGGVLSRERAYLNANRD